MLLPMPYRMAPWIDDLGFFPLFFCRMWFDLALPHVLFQSEEEVDWSCTDPEVLIFSYCRRLGGVIDLASKRMHELSGRLTVGTAIMNIGFRLSQVFSSLMIGWAALIIVSLRLQRPLVISAWTLLVVALWYRFRGLMVTMKMTETLEICLKARLLGTNILSRSFQHPELGHSSGVAGPG